MKCEKCKENNVDKKSNDMNLCLSCYNFGEEEEND